MRRKTSLIGIVVLVGACLLLLIPAVGCGRALNGLRPAFWRDGFPDAEIIYSRASELGFVNADGSGAAAFPFQLPHLDFFSTWTSPHITGDGETVLVTRTASPGRPGVIYAVRAGETAVDCQWSGIARLANDRQHLFLQRIGQDLEKYPLADCGTGNPPEEVYRGVSGALSPDEQYAAEVGEWRNEWGLQPKIVLRRLATGEASEIGAGDFPAWSRDGQWLAYTGADGIYLLANRPAAEPELLVPLERPEPDSGVPLYQQESTGQYYPPIVSWSPDGRWLVYHVYSSSPVDASAEYAAQYYSIFKVDVQTGETTKLLDGGYSPSWRWPVEEP